MTLEELLANAWVRGLVASVVVLTGILVVAAWATWVERRVAGRLQNRVGPNRVGWFGLLQPIADALKLLRKEVLVPDRADRGLFLLAPGLLLFFAMAAIAVVPWGPGLVAADLDIGLLWVLAMSGMMLVPTWIAGWSSNNKYSLVAGMRAAAQGISYEVPLLLSALVPVMLAGSFNLSDIAEAQARDGWYAIWPPGIGLAAFVIYFTTSLAEANRIPFDIPEAESELVAGVSTEYTGIAFGLFQMTEYIHTWLSSAVATLLFLGGWHGPFLGDSWWAGLIWMVLKTSVLFVSIMLLRWSLVRLRADQLMRFCWVWLVPISLGLVAATAIWIQVAQGGR